MGEVVAKNLHDLNLHPRDILNLADVKARIRYLFGVRKTMGWQVKAMQESNGHAHGYIARMLSDERYPWDWKWSTFTNLADALAFEPEVEVQGFVLAPSAMMGIGAVNPAFRGVGLLESMRLVRENLGLSAVRMGEAIGCSDTTIGKIENSDNPKLVSLMRYARALGGELKFVVGER